MIQFLCMCISTLSSLLLIFCKASVLRGVALREDRLFTDRGESSGSTRRRRRPAVAAPGRPRPSAEVGRTGLSWRPPEPAPRPQPPRCQRLPGSGVLRGEGWLRGSKLGDRRAGGKGCWPRTCQSPGPGWGEWDLAPDLGVGVRESFRRGREWVDG